MVTGPNTNPYFSQLCTYMELLA